MQGQRSTINSFPETFDFEIGSSSSNTGVDQQIIWNNMRNPVESHLPDFVLSPSETNITYGNAVAHDSLSLSSGNLGESSSSDNTRNQVARDDLKVEHGWSSSLSARTGAGPRLEERRYEPTSMLSLEAVNISLSSNQVATGPLFVQSSSSDGIPWNVNLNVGYVNNSASGDQIMGTGVCPHPYKSGGSETEQISSASGSSAPFGANSGSAGYLVEANDGRPGCSLDGRRISCKRKAIEGASGQLSLGGRSSCLHQAENSLWHAGPAHHNGGGSLSISTSSENPPIVSPQVQMDTRLGVGIDGVSSDSFPALGVAVNAEGSERNFRMRINPAHQQDSVPSNLLSTGSTLRSSHVWSPHQSSTLLPFNNSFDSRSTVAPVTASTQGQSNVTQTTGLSRSMQPFQWNGVSNSRAESSSNSPVVSGERGVVLREEANSRSMPRNISEHPMFLPSSEMRDPAQDPACWSLANGNVSIPGNVASTSRIGSSSGAHPLLPHYNRSTQYPRRLSELFRRSLLPSIGPESQGHSSRLPPLRRGPSASSQEIVLPSEAGQQGHLQPYPRSAFWMERQGDNAIGTTHSLRTLAAASEGRSRLVTEIRNVLDLMRRSENLRFEDVFVLDHSVFYGMADLHDRHRDMRLDVDNMSYEELLALEERIGNVNTGLSEESILKCLKKQKYLSLTKGAPSEVEPCCICQEEYVDGEDLGTLDCGHDFHTRCIRQWLMHKNLCPICKTTALVT